MTFSVYNLRIVKRIQNSIVSFYKTIKYIAGGILHCYTLLLLAMVSIFSRLLALMWELKFSIFYWTIIIWAWTNWLPAWALPTEPLPAISKSWKAVDWLPHPANLRDTAIRKSAPSIWIRFSLTWRNRKISRIFIVQT